MDAWTAMLTRSGFIEVTATAIVAEAGLVTGRRPDGLARDEQAGIVDASLAP